MSMTIPAQAPFPDAGTLDPSALALAALGWVLEDMGRAERLLALTGLTPAALRDGVMTAHVQAAVLEFLANHEPDLIACAEALAVTPGELVAAHGELAP